MELVNLTNAGKDPVEGDEMLKISGGLKIYYTHSAVGPSKEEAAKNWRNQQLVESDWIITITDHPQHDAYKTYRTKLRDWPSTSDFPDTKPELGS